MHLVLPPAPEAATNGFTAPDSSLRHRNSPGQTSTPTFQNQTGGHRDQALFATGAQTPRVNGAIPQQSASNRPPDQPSHIARLQDTLNRIEQIQPQTEALNQVADRARSVLNAHAVQMRYLNANNAQNTGNNNQLPQQPRTTPTPTVNSSGSATSPVNTQQPLNNVAPQSLLLARIASQIIGLELEIQRGNAPPLDTIVRARASLHAMLDARYRQPNIAISSEAEGLLLRLQNVYTRGYQIRQIEHMRHIPPATASYPGGPTQAAQTTGLYMVTAPGGEQMIISAPNLPQPAPANIPNFPLFPDAVHPPITDHLAAADGAMQNMVRQAVLNQRDAAPAAAPGAAGNANRNVNDNDHIGQNIRRFWLFLRLYFFCFLFTDSGTWERFYFVLGAFLISFFSESPILRRVFEMVVEPVQRHLEGLIHGQPPAPAPAQQDGNTNANTNNNTPEQRPAAAGGADHGLRRIERAFALFIASLIPGVGERQVEVRNAAEEAARNAQEQQAREAEERARDEAQNRDDADGQVAANNANQDGQ